MAVTPTEHPLTFHCTSCNGLIQTPISFAGVSAPCPYCAQIVTAPHPMPAQWVPAPTPQRAAIKRLSLPDQLMDPPLTAIRQEPRAIRPQPEDSAATIPSSNRGNITLDQLFETIVAMEERVESRPRLRRKGKVQFERPLRRTDDHALRSLRSR